VVCHGVSALDCSPIDARRTFSVPGLDGHLWNNEIKFIVQIINVINGNRCIMGDSLYNTQSFNADAIMQNNDDPTRDLP
jgi:hypothetical protein